MRPFQTLLLAFLLVPVLEIYLFIKVGSIIGALPTVLIIVVTAVLGAYLLRLQGFATMARLQASLAQGQLPAVAMVEGALLLLAGALLLTPGFFTDAVGFLLLVPPLRKRLAEYVLRRGLVGMVYGDGASRGWGRATEHGPQGPRTIEGEFKHDRDD